MPIRNLLLLLVICATAAAAQAQGPDAPGEATTGCAEPARLSPEAEQLAEILGVTAKLAEVRAHACSPATLEQLVLRQEIANAITLASLDVDAVVGQIDFERAQILETRTFLAGRQTRRVNLLSLANLAVSAGSGILTNALQFGSSTTAYVGDGVGIAGGGAGALLSILGLRVSGGTTTIGIAPNMLAAIFDKETEKHSVYPPDVWQYLNTKPLDYPRVSQPWRQALVEQWVSQKRIGPPAAAASQKKIHLLTSTFAEHSQVSLDVLVDRSLMLLDVRARVLLMKAELGEIVRAMTVAGKTAPGAGSGAGEPGTSGTQGERPRLSY